MIIDSFKTAFKNKLSRNWNCIYVAVDLHGTICDSLYSNNQSLNFYNYAKETLVLLSNMPSVKLILFTSTHPHQIKRYMSWLNDNNIFFDYVNENPECPSTELADFSRKLYFNVLLDDKAGFTPNIDWKMIHHWLIHQNNLDERKTRTT